MGLSISQMAMMSRLLDEALPLDATARRLWLETLSPAYLEIAPALWQALLPGESQVSVSNPPWTLPKVVGLDAASGESTTCLQAGARLGPYELLRPLGAGGMAEVWLARRADGALKRTVALKIPTLTRLRAELEQRFARERDILASLEHPHIARLYDAGIASDNGLPYFAMEYVEGQPLTDWCDARRLPIPARLELCLQVLDAMQFAHDKRVIHRDLKPSNILVTESGQVRLLDFGVAKLLEEEDQTQLTTVYGKALTPNYASPELLRGERLDARCDIYSFGVVLYELLTGTRPYHLQGAASVGLLEQAIARVEVEKPSTQLEREAAARRATTQDGLARLLRGDLDAVVVKTLAKEPAERYPSAADLAKDLRRYLEGRPITALPARFPYRLRKFVGRNKALFAVSTTAVAVIGLVVGYTLYRDTLARTHGPTAVAVSAKPEGTAATASVAPPAAFAPPLGSVAVLPFVDMSEKHDQAYFSDGLSEELINLLSQAADLRVPARTSSFYFKDKPATTADIARALNVAHVLEGSVRKSGKRLRITAQLIRADNGYHLWSQSYDRDDTDILAVQDDIGNAVVNALHAKLADQALETASRGTTNPEAYSQYLLGWHSMRRNTVDGHRGAAAAFGKAIELDPGYTRAYAGLAEAQANIGDFTDSSAEFRLAREAAEKAIALAPDRADGYRARAIVRHIADLDYAGARADFEHALALDTTNIDLLNWYARSLRSLGKLDASIAEYRKAVELDPLNSEALGRLGALLTLRHDYAGARAYLNRALELDSHGTFVLLPLSKLELASGHPGEALAAAKKIRIDDLRLGAQAIAEHSLGDEAASDRDLKSLETHSANVSAFQIAEVYAWRGDRDAAFAWLERAYRQRDGGYEGFKSDTYLEGFYTDPRYQALLREANLAD